MKLVRVTRQLCDQVDELLRAGATLSGEAQRWRLLAEKYRTQNTELSGALYALKAERPMDRYWLPDGRTFREGRPRSKSFEPDPVKRREKMIRRLDHIFRPRGAK